MVEDDNVAAVPGQGARDPDECLCCGLRSGEWDPGAPDLGHQELSQLTGEARRLALSGWMRYFSVDCTGFFSGPLAHRTNTAWPQHGQTGRASSPPSFGQHKTPAVPMAIAAICHLPAHVSVRTRDGCQCNLVQIDAGEIGIIWPRPQSE